jgi:hypothetical protein
MNFLPNVKEHAPLSARASVDHGVEVKTTDKHVNRAADRGCCVSTCSASSFPECADDALHESTTNAGGSGCATKPVVVEGVIRSLLVFCATLGDKHRIGHLDSCPERTEQSSLPDYHGKVSKQAVGVAEPIDPPRELNLFSSKSRCSRRIHVVIPPISMNSACCAISSRSFRGLAHDLGIFDSCRDLMAATGASQPPSGRFED